MAEIYLGTIVATTTAKNNTDTAAPFTIPRLSRLVIQPSAACYAGLIKSGATAVSSTTGLKVDADAAYETTTTSDRVVLSCVAVSGTVNVKVFQVL